MTVEFAHDPRIPAAEWTLVQILQGGTPDKFGAELHQFSGIYTHAPTGTTEIPCLCSSTGIWDDLTGWLDSKHAFCPRNDKAPYWIRVLHPGSHDTPIPEGTQLVDQAAVHVGIRFQD